MAEKISATCAVVILACCVIRQCSCDNAPHWLQVAVVVPFVVAMVVGVLNAFYLIWR